MARQNFFFFFGPLIKKFAHHWSTRRRAGFSCATLYVYFFFYVKFLGYMNFSVATYIKYSSEGTDTPFCCDRRSSMKAYKAGRLSLRPPNLITNSHFRCVHIPMEHPLKSLSVRPTHITTEPPNRA